MPVHGPGAEGLRLPVFRPGFSKTVFYHLPVLSPSSGCFPGETGTHTNTCTHRPKSMHLPVYGLGPSKLFFLTSPSCVRPPGALPGRRGLTHTNSFSSLRFVARGPSDHHRTSVFSLAKLSLEGFLLSYLREAMYNAPAGSPTCRLRLPPAVKTKQS